MDVPQDTKTRQAVSAAVIGNVLEWYDFAVYAYVAVYIAKNFFPQGDPVTALAGDLPRPTASASSRARSAASFSAASATRTAARPRC